MKKAEVQKVHETCVLKCFADYLSMQGIVLKIIERPDPPDAVVEINGAKTWIELTNHFFIADGKENIVAKIVTSACVTDKKHYKIPKEKKFVLNPMECSSVGIKKVILAKYDKATMQDCFVAHGQGILIVGIMDPFRTLDEIVQNEREKILDAISNKTQFFKKIYLYCSNQGNFMEFLTFDKR